MLPANLQKQWAAAAQDTIKKLAQQPATYIKQGRPPRALEVAIRIAAPTDIEIVNAYGINARIITVAADDLAPDVLELFDRFWVAGETFTANGVRAIRLGNALIGYKCFSRGAEP